MEAKTLRPRRHNWRALSEARLNRKSLATSLEEKRNRPGDPAVYPDWLKTVDQQLTVLADRWVDLKNTRLNGSGADSARVKRASSIRAFGRTNLAIDTEEALRKDSADSISYGDLCLTDAKKTAQRRGRGFRTPCSSIGTNSAKQRPGFSFAEATEGAVRRRDRCFSRDSASGTGAGTLILDTGGLRSKELLERALELHKILGRLGGIPSKSPLPPSQQLRQKILAGVAEPRREKPKKPAELSLTPSSLLETQPTLPTPSHPKVKLFLCKSRKQLARLASPEPKRPESRPPVPTQKRREKIVQSPRLVSGGKSVSRQMHGKKQQTLMLNSSKNSSSCSIHALLGSTTESSTRDAVPARSVPQRTRPSPQGVRVPKPSGKEAGTGLKYCGEEDTDGNACGVQFVGELERQASSPKGKLKLMSAGKLAAHGGMKRESATALGRGRRAQRNKVPQQTVNIAAGKEGRKKRVGV